MQAVVVKTLREVDEAPPGLYVVRSGSAAYFPMMGLVEAGHAKLEGEFYEDEGRTVLVRIQSPSSSAQRKMMHDSSAKRTITIGAEFFITALKDYNDWPLKWWREVVQNAVDAGGTNVDLGSEKLDDGTILVWCDDNGRGMDEDTIINKFLVLGGTTKTGPSGAAGGFGKAKELILLPWISWRIHSRETIVEGAGIDYTVKTGAMRRGTRLEVVMPPDKHTDGVIALGFLQKCYLPHVVFTVNGSPAQADLAGAKLVDTVPDKAEVYFTPSTENQSYIYVRARGLFMFARYVGDVPGFVIAELIAPSIEILTANRDGFRDYHTANGVDKLGERIAKDNLSAFKAGKGMIRKKFEGTGRFRAAERASAALDQIGPYGSGALSNSNVESVIAVMGDYARGEEDRLQSLPAPAVAQAMLDQKFLGPNHLEAAIKQLVWEPDFYLVNEIDGFFVPKKFFPETMTPTILKLAKTWVELCRYVMMQLGSDKRFGVGFVFSSSAAAMAMTEEDREGRDEFWLMLNPFKDMYSQRDLWRPANDPDLKWIYAAAIHEATHIADGMTYHDESFAAALTRNMAKCADGFRKIRQIAAGIRTRGNTSSPDTD